VYVCIYSGAGAQNIFDLLAQFKRGDCDGTKVRLGRLQVCTGSILIMIYVESCLDGPRRQKKSKVLVLFLKQKSCFRA